MSENPDMSFRNVSCLIGKEWRRLPIPRKIEYEERAQKQNEESHAHLLSNGPLSLASTSESNKNFLYPCLWNNCDNRFEDFRGLIYHLAAESDGHILQTFKNNCPEKLQCMWHNCQRIKKNIQPFANIHCLIRHVKEVHLGTLSKSIQEHQTNKEDTASVVPSPLKACGQQPLITESTEEYVFDCKRLVDMGYFLKSLQMLNDHKGRKCNFSDMKVCAETREGKNDGIVFTCNRCPTTKVIWMEDPDFDSEPPSPPSCKSKSQKPCVQAKLAPDPQIKTCSKSLQKSSTQAPDSTPAGHLQTFAKPQITMKRKLQNYLNPPPMKENTTLQSRLQPVIDQQESVSTQTQASILIQSKAPVIGQSLGPAISQLQGSLISQTQLVRQLQDSIISQSQIHTSVQIPTIAFPQTTSIKQELILPDETSRSLINSMSETIKVEMTFCVDQGDKSESVPSDTYTAMDVTKDIATTHDAFAHTQTSFQCLSGQLSSSTAMDVNKTHAIASMDTLPVDLNLVKKEVYDEALSD